jgi:protein ImuA
MPDAHLAEDGAPNVEGLAQFGLAPERLILARTHCQADALWAAEQALKLTSALALCVIAPTKKSLSLTATRRLLLNAETHKTRCVLLRLDSGGASAAWTRWRIAAASSQGAGRELGPPRFAAQLERNRAGPSDLSWSLNWNAHDHVFAPDGAPNREMDGAVAAASADRPAAPRPTRAA